MMLETFWRINDDGMVLHEFFSPPSGSKACASVAKRYWRFATFACLHTMNLSFDIQFISI